MKEGDNKFGHIHDSGLRWALERIDRQTKFEKTIIFKFCSVIFVLAILCALSTLIIGRTNLGFSVGFVSILLFGFVSIVMLVYVDLIPFIKKIYISYRKRHLSNKN